MLQIHSTPVEVIDQLISQYTDREAFHLEVALKFSRLPKHEELTERQRVIAATYSRVINDALAVRNQILAPEPKRTGLFSGLQALFKSLRFPLV